MWKWLIGGVIVVALLCGGGGLFLWQSGLSGEFLRMMHPETKPKLVRLGPAVKDDLVKSISTPGQIEPKRFVEISAQVSARILKMNYHENDRVEKGWKLVELDGRDLEAQVRSAKAQLKSEEARRESARSTEENALSERTRREKLFESGDIPKSEFDQFDTEYQRAKHAKEVADQSIEIAKANITRAEKDLENTIIIAPFDGVVTKINAEEGELVVVGTLNSPGSVIMEVADPSVMLLKARVDEANVAFVQNKQVARVYVNAFPTSPMVGVVEQVGLKKEIDKDGTAYFLTDIVLQNPEKLMLRSGMTANADIGVETFKGVIKVPSQAVQDRVREELPAAVTEGNPFVDKNKKFVRVVYVLDAEGKSVAVPVSVGASDLTDTVILGGLKEGDRVVVGPFKELVTLRDGQVLEEEKVDKPGAATPTIPTTAEAAQKKAGGA